MSAGAFIMDFADDTHEIHVLVDGMHCPSCVAAIEGALHKRPEITGARLNLSTRRLRISWQGARSLADQFLAQIHAMGYHAVPFDPATAETEEKRNEKFLLRCLALAGFASGNLMLFSVPLWATDAGSMGEGTRALFHWLQACIAIPAIAYAGRPFFRSAVAVLREGRGNMDVPISVAVILASAMSLLETITHGEHAYFDSAVMLLFFLLIGRYLEARARGKARSAAQDLLRMMQGSATIRTAEGNVHTLPLGELREGMVMLVAVGEKIGADGVVIAGASELDTSLITGESLPRATEPGAHVYAGTLNLSAPLEIRIVRAGEQSLLAEIVRMMETAEQSQSRYVTVADRLSRWYTPAVHLLALATFCGWFWWGHMAWQEALLLAATVLIITCPCALGLAVPVVHVLASGYLLRRGILLKSGSALERLASISCAVFDKTGTLTLGKPRLLPASIPSATHLQLAASLASHSRHPLARALTAAYQGPLLPLAITEHPGFGLESMVGDVPVRLGRRSWAAPDAPASENGEAVMELWLANGNQTPVQFTFTDQLRADAKIVLDRLKAEAIPPILLSGDRREITQHVAAELAIDIAESELTPLQKTERIVALQQRGERVLMVGDGLNDAPSLAVADVSMSPASGMDITQNSADIVFQGDALQPVITAWRTACTTQRLVRQNFVLAIGYNVVAIPLAVAGYVTPLVAALAMSGSSLLVIANAMRLTRMKDAS